MGYDATLILTMHSYIINATLIYIYNVAEKQ